MSEETEWLDWRRQGIGASDVAGIVGLSPWASPWSVWASKVGLLPDSEPSTKMRAGKYAEKMIRPWFEDDTGLYVGGEQALCERPDSVARCTVDGLVYESPVVLPEGQMVGVIQVPFPSLEDDLRIEPLGCLEMKNEASSTWTGIPAHYQCQGQWQMHVTGCERVWFAVLHFGWNLGIYELERDQDDIDFLAETVDAFWQRHVVPGVAPATDGHQATLDALARVYADSTPDGVEVDPSLVELWEHAKKEAKAADGVVKEHAAALQAALGEREEGTVDGQRAVSWRPQTRTGVDTGRLKAEYPEVAAELETSTTFRVLRAHKVKS